MKIGIPYGKSSMPLELNDGRPIDVVSPRETPRDESSLEISLSNPQMCPELVSFLSRRKKILVVINDHTRPTPTSTVLKNLDLKEKEVTTIVASGTHRPPSVRELEELLGGPHPPYGRRVIVHDANDDSQLMSIGRTSRGTELQFNKHLFDTDGIIVVGSVEPHYYAGFTGGRKFLLPALAGFRSIEMNHSLALDSRSTILRLEGNPVHEDFMEALDIFHRYDDIFSIQLVLNRDHQITHALSGHIVHSFKSAVERAKEIYVAPVEAKADIIVTVAAPPLDLDLYQAHKAIENVKLALKDRGVVILVSPCIDGVGLRGFYDLLAYGGSVNASNVTKETYRLGYHKAAKLAQLSENAKIFGVTDLQPGTLKAIGMSPFQDVQSAVDEASKLKGNNSRILIVLDGCLTVPVPKI
jgi:nickel-dependent lactate racemase